MNINTFTRPDLVELRPYEVKEVKYRIKMDANENPFDVPQEIKRLLAQELLELPLNRYPDATAKELRAKLSAQLSVNIEQIVVGNGSDELITYLISAFGRNDTRIVYPTPTFSMYEILSRATGVETRGVPLTETFEIPVDKLIAQLKKDGTNIVFLSRPNNPTGNCFDHQGIIEIIEQNNTLVVLDEAYYEFSQKTFLPLLSQYANLIILRTFSKAYGLAGLRIGYMIAHQEITTEVHKVRLPYNLNSFSQRAALKLLEYQTQADTQIELIKKERDRIFKELSISKKMYAYPTEANFVLFRTQVDADTVFERLLGEGILIRNLNKPGPLKNCLRVTAGTPEENDVVLAALELE